jgi:hypothetical protein
MNAAEVWRHDIRPVRAQVGGADAEDVPHPRIAGGANAGRGVFHHYTLRGRNTEEACSREVPLGVRLALAHVLPRNQDPRQGDAGRRQARACQGA